MAIARLVVVAATVAASAAQSNICGSNNTIGQAVISAVNLTFPGLEAVAAAVSQGDLNTACEALATYYKTSNTSWWYRIGPVTPGTGMAGGIVDAMVLHDDFYLAGVNTSAVVPRNPDGGLDWLDKGPRNDVEFMNCLNRHDSFVYLLQAWQATGNPIYSTYFDALVKDWVLHLPCPNALSRGTACVPAGLPGQACSWEDESPPGAQACATGTMESPWRSLEMGIRMSAEWPTSFFGFQAAAEFSTTARVLMALAVSEHFSALAVDGGHPGRGTPNWEMTQWQGLVTASVTFPELKNSSTLLSMALSELTTIMAAGVYPDGVETEQASGYDMGTAGDFYGTLTVLRNGGDALPPANFSARVEKMWEYGSFVSDPMGCLPRNGDSDLCNNGYNPTVTAYFNRTDWTYVHTNGQQGTLPPLAPVQGPSSIFPWAGQVALRSGYDQAASWTWFDVGPYGSSGHAHRDKLNLVLHARGSMLLIDSGRFAYAGTDLSNTLHEQYASYTHAHNTITIDGCDQLPTPAVASEPVSNNTWSFTPSVDTVYGNMSAYNAINGTATHTRAVYYSRPAGWMDKIGAGTHSASDDGDWLAVVDVITSDRWPRTVQATWHLHPNSSGVAVDPVTGIAVVGGVAAATGQPTTAQACVIPAGKGPMSSTWTNVTIIKGQYQDPAQGHQWQGWYSQSYDDAWPAPTLVYDAQVSTTAYFAWLIIPSSVRGDCVGTVDVLSTSPTSVVLGVTVGGQPQQRITVPIGQ